MDIISYKKAQTHNLIFWGTLLFLLGLIVGLLVPALANPRMALSSHIEGVFNGMLLIVLGLIWNRVELSKKWLGITYWLAIYGTFANWLGILIAAVFNAGKMLNVAAEGKEGNPIIEAVITFLLVTLSVAMIIVAINVLIGLKRGKALH